MREIPPAVLAVIHDQGRLAALRRLNLLDTPHDEAFDRLTSLASRTLHTPTAVVALVADDRQFFKSAVGLPEALKSEHEAPLSFLLGAVMVASPGTTAVENAREDPRIDDAEVDAAAGLLAYLGTPLVTSDGQPVGYLAVLDSRPRRWTARDVAITGDLARAVMTEIELGESEQQHRQLIDLSPEPIAVHVDGTLAYLNAAAVGLVGGRCQEELLGRDIMDFVHPDDRAAVEARLKATRSGHANPQLEERFVTIDGRTVDVEVVAFPVTFRGRAATQVVMRDITDRVKAERTMRFLDFASTTLGMSLDYLETLEVLASFAVPTLAELCMIDVVDDTGSLARLVVLAEDPEKQRLADELARRFPPDWDSPQPSVEALRKAKPVLVRDVDEATLARGTRGPEHARLIGEIGIRSALFVPIATVERTLGVLTLAFVQPGLRFQNEDVPLVQELARRAAFAIENARLYRVARDAVRVREEFMSIASHELRTPLAALLLTLHRLGRAIPPELADASGRATRQAERLSLLIDNILDVSRTLAGRTRLQRERVDLTMLAGEVVQRFTPTAMRAGCTLALTATGPAFGEWDRLRLEQVLTNLLSNAIKYGGGKPVAVEVRALDDVVQLIVRDRGIGIAPSDAERVFDRFERAVSARSYGGLGLGLFITREIVEAHGGTVRVESGLGEGARFIVTLPRAPSLTPRNTLEPYQ